MTNAENFNAVTPVRPDPVPIPPRYWWLERIIVGSVVLIIILGLIRWRWGVYADRLLQAEIDGYIAAGQPVYDTDFLLPSVPDDQNAAFALRAIEERADDLRQWTQPRNRRERRSLMDRSADPEVLDALADAAEVLALARQAARMPAVQWEVECPPPGPHDEMVALMLLQAAVEYRNGDTEEVLSIIHDTLRYSRHVAAQRTLFAALIYGAAVNQVADLIEEMLPSVPAAAGGFEPQQALMQTVMLELADNSLQESFCLALYRERAFHLWATETVVHDPPGWWGQMIIPMVQLDAVGMLRRDTQLVQAMASADYATYLQRVPTYPIWSGVNLKSATRILSGLVEPDPGASLVKAWSNIARQRLAALALAVWLFRADTGAFPADLGELVPVYLPELPKNPFAPQAKSFESNLSSDWPCLLAPGLKNGKRSIFYLNGKPGEGSTTNPVN